MSHVWPHAKAMCISIAVVKTLIPRALIFGAGVVGASPFLMLMIDRPAHIVLSATIIMTFTVVFSATALEHLSCRRLDLPESPPAVRVVCLAISVFVIGMFFCSSAITSLFAITICGEGHIASAFILVASIPLGLVRIMGLLPMKARDDASKEVKTEEQFDG